MTVSEKVSYLKGLADGLGLDESVKADRILKAVIDVLESVGAAIGDLETEVEDLGEQLDAVDEDLSNLEDDFYEEDGENCDCDGCKEVDGEEEEDDENFYEVECPACHDTIYLSEDMIAAGGMDCPNCGTDLEFDLGDAEGDRAEGGRGAEAEE